MLQHKSHLLIERHLISVAYIDAEISAIATAAAANTQALTLPNLLTHEQMLTAC